MIGKTRVRFVQSCPYIRERARALGIPFAKSIPPYGEFITVLLPPQKPAHFLFKECGTAFVWQIDPVEIPEHGLVGVCEHMIEID